MRWLLLPMLLAACSGTAPVNTPWPALDSDDVPLADASTAAEQQDASQASGDDATITGQEVLTHRSDEGCVMASRNGAELACVAHALNTLYAVSVWRIMNVSSGAMVESYRVYEGKRDGGAVLASEVRRINERLRLGRFERLPVAVRADHELAKIVAGKGPQRTLSYQGRSAELVLPPAFTRDTIIDDAMQRRCCDWRPVAASPLKSHIALMMRLSCRFNDIEAEQASGCFIKNYTDATHPYASEVIVAPLP